MVQKRKSRRLVDEPLRAQMLPDVFRELVFSGALGCGGSFSRPPEDPALRGFSHEVADVKDFRRREGTPSPPSVEADPCMCSPAGQSAAGGVVVGWWWGVQRTMKTRCSELFLHLLQDSLVFSS